MNVPVAAIALALTPGLIPESRSESATRHFDAAGAVTITAGLSVLAYALLDAATAGWGSTKIVSLLAVAVALIGAFVAIELRSKAPLVPFRIFRLRTLTGANVVGVLLGASLFSMFYFISLYMQQVLGYSPIHAGLSYLPLAVTIILAAGIGGQLVTRFGFKPILAAGMLSVSAGLLWFSQVSVGGGFLTDILGASLLAAIGLGFGFVTSTIAAVSGVDQREQGVASGLINTSQQIGGALGLAVLSTIATSRTDDVMATGHSTLAERAHRGLPERLPRRSGDRAARLRRDAGPDPEPRQQGPRRDGAGRVVPGRGRSLGGLERGNGRAACGSRARRHAGAVGGGGGPPEAGGRGAGPACAPI